jgi:hypothetical protein
MYWLPISQSNHANSININPEYDSLDQSEWRIDLDRVSSAVQGGGGDKSGYVKPYTR